MNYKTTIVLLLLLAVGGTAGFLWHFRRSEDKIGASTKFFNEELKPDSLTVIKVSHGARSYVLQRPSAKGEWALPGKWPARDIEVRELVRTITTIRPRFEPFSVEDKKAILDSDPLVLKVTVDGKERTVTMAEEPGGTNPFVRATYARLDNEDEILRLAPGLVAALDHDQEYFRKRRLFDKVRVAGDDPADRTDQIAAAAVTITRTHPDKSKLLLDWSSALVGLATSALDAPLLSASAASALPPAVLKDAKYRLVKVGDDWEMAEPARDRIDPAKAKTLLAGLSDLWAESFLSGARKPADMGLTAPFMTIDVIRPSGSPLEVQIGDVAGTRDRFEERDGPPNKFTGEPQKIKVRVEEKVRYARLKDHDLFFEVKVDKLDDNAVPLDPNTLRDPQLARFKTADARRLEIRHGGETLVLAKSGEKTKQTWKIEPSDLEAEENAIENLLRELSQLHASNVKDMIDSTDLKKYGLDKPAGSVKLWIEETRKGEAPDTPEEKKKKVERVFVFRLGTPAPSEMQPSAKDPKTQPGAKGPEAKVKDRSEKGKLFVQVDGWPRINRINDDDLLKMVQAKPNLPLAFRKRQLVDVKAEDLTRVDVQQPGGSFSLKREDRAWQLVEPIKAELDAKKLGDFPDGLAQLRAVEFVGDSPSSIDLDKLYGLANPVLKATIHFTGKPPQILAVGHAKKLADDSKKEDGGKKDGPAFPKAGKKDDDTPSLYFARLDQGPVFLIRKALHDDLSRDSVAYRTDTIWSIKQGDIAQIGIDRVGDKLRLQREKDAWKVTLPFTAGAHGRLVEFLTKELAQLKAGAYVANQARDLAPYGLDKPHMFVRLSVADPKASAAPAEYTLLIGKEHAGGRYARLDGSPSVFVVHDARLLSLLEIPVNDLLSRSLLQVEPETFESIHVKGKTRESTFHLERKKDRWQVTDSPAPPFVPGDEPRREFVKALADLGVERIMPHQPRIDWTKFGLADPQTTFTIVIRKGDKTETHTLAVGGDAGLEQRYARWDQDPTVVVLGQTLIKELSRSYLDFVQIQPARFLAEEAVGVNRRMPDGDVDIVKKGTEWRLLGPDRAADVDTVRNIILGMANLRIQRVAAFPVQDLARFGLDKPAIITLKLEGAEDKVRTHVLKLGSKSPVAEEGHFALLDKGDAVVVLDPGLSKLLLARPANFTDHNLKTLSASAVDEVVLTTPQPTRRAVFKLVDGQWKMTEPVAAAAEARDLDNLVLQLSRLRADEILTTEKIDARELKGYGLDRPRIECRLSGQGKTLLELAVGAAENPKDKTPRHFARLIGKERPVAFVLPAGLSAELQAEYRERKPWSDFDPAQVEKIQVTDAAGTSFALQNAGPDWFLLDKAVRKANPKLVAETLDTLARLETPRYVVDARATLQIYGLATPAQKIELELPTGKRALLIGHVEGGSQNRYASVAGSDSVFLLSPAAVQRLMRGAAAYVVEN